MKSGTVSQLIDAAVKNSRCATFFLSFNCEHQGSSSLALHFTPPSALVTDHLCRMCPELDSPFVSSPRLNDVLPSAYPRNRILLGKHHSPRRSICRRPRIVVVMGAGRVGRTM